jgi:hypothetical protein
MITAVKHSRRLRATTTIFLVAEALDVLTTFAAITHFNAIEENPVVNHIGWTSALLFKLASIIAFVWFLQTDKPKIFLKIDWIFPAIVAIPVVWNIIQLAKVVIR